MKKKALILGISGQDGILLSKLLIKKKYHVTGILRSKRKTKLLDNKIKKIYKKKISRRFLYFLINKNKFNEIYFLIGQSEAFSSMRNPETSLHSNFILFTYVLHACIKSSKHSKIFYASSGQIYGDTKKIVKENSKKNPMNPYALSKYISMEYIKYIRKYYKLKISVGIFFNHDSIYRSKNNISMKLINFLKKKNLKNEKLELGNINVYRDWGYAEEYVEAIHKITMNNKSEDFIVATGKSLFLKDIINFAFKLKNLNYKNFIKINKKKFGKNEIKKMSTNINKIRNKIKWHPKKDLKSLINEQLLKH